MGDPSRKMINLLRVLDRCKMISNNMENLRDGQLVRLEKLLGFTKSELADIEADNNASTLGIPENTVDELNATISAISCELQHHLQIRQQQQKAYVEVEAHPMRHQNEAQDAGETAQATSLVVLKPAAARVPKRKARSARQELLDTEDNEKPGAANEDHDTIQDNLTKDMVDMAGNLKEIIKQTGETLKTDKQLIEDASVKADVNIKKQDEANLQLSNQIKRSGGCWLWLLLLGIACNFFGMVIFMRLT
eukprot:m.647044 g.647044  ORF g.647044 m.647044 type:complete len:249 (+) comp22653_c0_seq9:129-875(+)